MTVDGDKLMIAGGYQHLHACRLDDRHRNLHRTVETSQSMSAARYQLMTATAYQRQAYGSVGHIDLSVVAEIVSVRGDSHGFPDRWVGQCRRSKELMPFSTLRVRYGAMHCACVTSRLSTCDTLSLDRQPVWWWLFALSVTMLDAATVWWVSP